MLDWILFVKLLIVIFYNLLQMICEWIDIFIFYYTICLGISFELAITFHIKYVIAKLRCLAPVVIIIWIGWFHIWTDLLKLLLWLYLRQFRTVSSIWQVFSIKLITIWCWYIWQIVLVLENWLLVNVIEIEIVILEDVLLILMNIGHCSTVCWHLVLVRNFNHSSFKLWLIKVFTLILL